MKSKLTTGLLPGQWIDRPKPKLVPTLTQRVCDAISKGKGRDMVGVANEIRLDREDLDLTDDTIKALRQRLSDEINQRQKLNAALKDVLDKRTERMSR
jgi:hypothetical protein